MVISAFQYLKSKLEPIDNTGSNHKHNHDKPAPLQQIQYKTQPKETHKNNRPVISLTAPVTARFFETPPVLSTNSNFEKESEKRVSKIELSPEIETITLNDDDVKIELDDSDIEEVQIEDSSSNGKVVFSNSFPPNVRTYLPPSSQRQNMIKI